MIEGVTLGQVALGVTFSVGLITGISYLKRHLTEWIQSAMSEPLGGIKTDINELKTEVIEVGLDSQKNFLVARLAEAERGVEWDEVERERFWEQYDKYQSHGGNSYIKDKVEKLKRERKI